MGFYFNSNIPPFERVGKNILCRCCVWHQSQWGGTVCAFMLISTVLNPALARINCLAVINDVPLLKYRWQEYISPTVKGKIYDLLKSLIAYSFITIVTLNQPTLSSVHLHMKMDYMWLGDIQSAAIIVDIIFSAICMHVFLTFIYQGSRLKTNTT